MMLTVEEAGSNWSRMEVEAAVAAYREMLMLQLAGADYNKRQRNLALQVVIGRSAGSIERKHQNISAVLNNRGFFYIPGYKPLGNFQGLLEEIVTAEIVDAVAPQALAEETAGRSHFEPTIPVDILSILAPPPAPSGESIYKVGEEPQNGRLPNSLPRRDYLALEARNALLGSSGEDLVMRYEHQRLWTAGVRHLADRVEQVSSTRGDHLGYDVLSFEDDGRERLIEVKTTQSGALTPFFLSENELRVSIEHASHYHLYRVYDFLSRKNPKLFQLQGALGATCRLHPVVYRGSPA